MLNNVVLMGRLTDKPELRKTPSDISVTSFTIAIDRGYQKQGAERQTDWIDCVAWRQQAEFICKYFDKGSMIAVTGSIQTRTYTDKNENRRKATEIIIDNASFCGGKRESGTGDTAPAVGNAPASFSNGSDADFEEVSSDDDLPF